METSTKPIHTVKEHPKKKYRWFIGIDVSKTKLDYAVFKGSELSLHYQGKNTCEDVQRFCNELKKIKGFNLRTALFCMEQTGVYSNPSLEALHKMKADVVCEHPLRIKRSLGLIRGKDDREDSIRIALYAEKNKDNLILWEQRRPEVVELMYLSALRSRLMGVSIIITNPIKEHATFLSPELRNKIKTLCGDTDRTIKADLVVIENAIKTLINGDAHLKHLMKIITSVKCVGPVTAVEIILATNEFKGINCPKKFACYAGVAPFKTESGSVVRRARVSKIANRRTKALLHVCAVNAIKFDNDLRAYYERKKEKEGKPKMLVINAVRYKLILRIFACLKQDRLYEQTYARPAGKQRPDLKIEETIDL